MTEVVMSERLAVTMLVCKLVLRQGSIIVTIQSFEAVNPEVVAASFRVEINLMGHCLPEVAVLKGPWLAAIHESDAN